MLFTDIAVEWSPITFIFYLVIILGSYLIVFGLNKI